MKICILTYPLHSNFGYLMQAYALQRVLMYMGYEVCTIDIRKNTISFLSRIKYFLFSVVKKYVLNKDIDPFRHWPNQREQMIMDLHTWDFIRNHLCLTKRVYSYRDLKIIGEQYDFYIVGSDQVWRKDYIPDVKLYYFDFLPVYKPRISYAASFGKSEINYSDIEVKRCAKLLTLFRAVSVREKDGVMLCNKYFNRKSVQVLDPTLLLDKLDYDKIIDKNEIDSRIPTSNYVLVYLLDPNNYKLKVINDFVKERGLDIYSVTVPDYGVRGRCNIRDCIFPSISTWLTLFKHADYIFTDSFHGSVFSIIYQKNFYVFDNKDRGSSRITSLLTMFALDEHLISDKYRIDKNLVVDYCKVNNIMQDKKKCSLLFIQNSIDGK